MVEQGKALFNSPDSGGKCVRCHFGGGAYDFQSRQFNVIENIGIERLPAQPVRLVAQSLGISVPVDGGLGKLPFVCQYPGVTEPGIGTCEFRTPPVIEAANTPPYFHNNSINTLEAAVEFYNSRAFNEVTDIPGGIHLEPTEVTAIACLLRTLNALENIRNSNFLETQVLQACAQKDGQAKQDQESITRKLRMAWRGTRDAIDVLDGAQYLLFNDAAKYLEQALDCEGRALKTASQPKRTSLLKQAIAWKTAARSLILVE